MRQDPTHPTGVAETSTSLQVETISARDRKADAAVQAYINKDWTLAKICRKLGYPTEVAALAAIEKRMQEYLRFHPRSQAAIREMAGRRLERISRVVMKKAENFGDPEQLAAAREARGLIMDFVKLYGAQAPQQIVVTNPAQEQIEDMARRLTSNGAPALPVGDIFGDDADDAEILALEQRRKDAKDDIVDAEFTDEDPAAELDAVDKAPEHV